jgi:UDP-N-acetylmuramoylalanine--D-glutamate ligase
VRERVRHLVLIGEGAPRMAAAWAGLPTGRAATLAEAVDQAFAAARAARTAARTKTAVVLFSPGCASFDMFRDYEDRGRRFKAEVERLERAEART